MSHHHSARVLASAAGLAALASAVLADPPVISDNDCPEMPFILPGPPPPSVIPSAILRFLPPYTEDDYRPSCAGNFPVYNSVWVQFQAASTAYEVSLCGPSTAEIPDLLATVYRHTNPANPCATRVEIACIDDTSGCGGGQPGQPEGLLPRIALYGLVPGKNYAIQVLAKGYPPAACNASPCTQGDYTLSVYPIDPPPCALNVPPEIPDEGELNPCDLAARINDGCLLSPPGFSPIALGESRHGTSYNDGSSPDEDWYRVPIAPPGTLLTMGLRAEFDAEMQIVTHAPGQPCVQTVVASATYVECEPTHYLTAAVGGGEHFLVVRPTSLVLCQDARRNYQLTANGDPALPITGACCNGPQCFQAEKAACWNSGATYYGDLVECADITCFACPPEALHENEPMNCPAHGFANFFNGGCSFSNTAPPLLQASYGQAYCGVSGTMYDAPPPAGDANLRDSDWYRLELPGVGAGEVRRVSVQIHAEFPAQVILVNPELGSSPCSTWQTRVVADAAVIPGESATVSACVVRRAGLSFFGHVWIIIRPATLGPPSEIPCGVEYTFTAELEPCDGLGACCLITPGGASSGCQLIAGTDCIAQGGHFFGENTQCAEACCPCDMGTPPENEPACGNPVDNVNGGCGSPTLAFGAQLAAPGNTVCGTSRWAGVSRDTDWFVYNHTGGDIVFSVLAEFVPQAGIIEPGPGTTPSQQCYGFQILAMSTGAACLPHVVSRTAPPGEYWLWLGPDLGLNTPFECGAPYRAAATSALTPASCSGDVNCDGGVDFFDIDRFVAALGYPAGAGWPHACPWLNGDCDGDGDVDFFDIDPFVARLGSTCE